MISHNITIQPCNTRYRLKVYKTPDGNLVSGKLPAHLGGKHFGSTLIQFGNESFSWFESTGNKSRINFLKLMRAGRS